MIKIVILSFCILSAKSIVGTSISGTELGQSDQNNGPVSSIIKNFPEQNSKVIQNSDENKEPISDLALNNDESISNISENVAEQNSNVEVFSKPSAGGNDNEQASNIMENLSEHTSNLLHASDPAPDNGPVSNMMENLSEHTSSVTSELLNQLSTKIQRTTKTLTGNIEVIVTSALKQLSQPIEDFENKINSTQCQPLVTLDELQKRIDTDLAKCTQNLSDILTAFQNDASDFESLLEQNIKNIIALPKRCEGLSTSDGFGSHVSCYVENIAEVNKQIAAILNTASMTLVHTRQLTEQAVQEGRGCADNVVATIVESLDKMLASCQLIEI